MVGFEPVSAQLDSVGKHIVDSAYRVHSQMGPGLLESVYEECMLYDLRGKGLWVDSQVEVSICYFATALKSKMRLDILLRIFQVFLQIRDNLHCNFHLPGY